MIVSNIERYDGSLLKERFAYRFFKKDVLPIGNIISFVAPADVKEHLVDLEDSLNNDFIHSDRMIHFLWEIPICNHYFGAVAFQRLFNTNIGNNLYKFIQAPIELDGDDIIVHKEHEQGGIVQTKGKASVSITCLRGGVAVGHTGINIEAGNKAPAFAYSTKLPDNQVEEFQKVVINNFYNTVNDIFIAGTKTV